MSDTIKVFLGGTCNNDFWREKLIKMFNEKIEYFNPVVKDWTIECQKKENEYKEKSDYNLYVITNKMTGVYSIAEVVCDACLKPKNTIFCVLYDGFDEGQKKSLKAVSNMVDKLGCYVAESLEQIAEKLNNINDGNKKNRNDRVADERI